MRKRKSICIALLLCSLLLSLAGCGGKEKSGTIGGEPSAEGDISKREDTLETKELTIATGGTGADILSEAEEVLRIKKADTGCYFLRMQYYKGEAVQLWMQVLDQDGNPLNNETSWAFRTREKGTDAYKRILFLYREDGTKESLIEYLPVLDHAIDDPRPVIITTTLAGETPPPITDDMIKIFDKRWACSESNSQWYLAQDGSCYCWWDFKEGNNEEYTFMKIEPSGEMAYSVLMDDYVRVCDMLQLPDGRIFMILRDKPASVIRVAEINPDTGALEGIDVAVSVPGSPGKKWSTDIGFVWGMDDDGNICTMPGSRTPDIGGVYRLNLADGSLSVVMSFLGTTYTFGDSTIDLASGVGYYRDELHVLPDGNVEILWRKEYLDGDRAVGFRETLRPADADRPIVTLRAESVPDWMRKQVAWFNRTNSDWQIVLEEFASSNAVDLEEYARLTSVQIATGKGPDMIYGSFMDSYVPGMLEQGALLELSGPLRESGVREEDYLPLTFDAWRLGDSVYGVTAESGVPQLTTIDSRVLGDVREPDIETLTKALQAWEEDSVLLGKNDAAENLRRFLQGSESLWGMVDWEKGTCDFGGELFQDLLEISKRYGYDERRKVPNLMRTDTMSSIYAYQNPADLAVAGRTACGTLFDDGCRGTVSGTRTLMVNAASGAKEGAVEFLCVLLSERAQDSISGGFPVRREQLEEWVREEAARAAKEDGVTADISYIDSGEFVKDTRILTAADMTEERIQEYLAALEAVRALPARNRPIIDIICEEAGYYFNGDKPIKEVVKVIESKVGLYLAERQ